MIDEMSGLKATESKLVEYKDTLSRLDIEKLQILKMYIKRELVIVDAQLLACQEKKARLQKTMEDYINKSFDVRYIEQCIEYGCGGGMGWDQIIKDAYREQEQEQEQKQELLMIQQQDVLDFENQTGIFDFPPSNGPEDKYVGCLPETCIFDPY